MGDQGTPTELPLLHRLPMLQNPLLHLVEHALRLRMDRGKRRRVLWDRRGACRGGGARARDANGRVGQPHRPRT